MPMTQISPILDITQINRRVHDVAISRGENGSSRRIIAQYSVIRYVIVSDPVGEVRV